jgi:hypothetical protein
MVAPFAALAARVEVKWLCAVVVRAVIMAKVRMKTLFIVFRY